MIRFVVRTLGLWLLAGGFAAAVIDGMKSIAGSTLRLTSTLETWADLAPGTIALSKAFVEGRIGAGLWTGLEAVLHLVPTWLLFGGLGLVLIALARPRQERIGIVP